MNTLTSRTRLALLALLLSLGWSASAWAATPDSWITAKVKMGLLTSETVNPLDVNVDTINGKVTMHGRVNTQAEKDEATRVAKGTDGVKDVRNVLAVVASSHEDMVKATDDDLKASLKQRFKDDAVVKDSNISVASVNDGTVVLTGQSDTVSEHVRALEITRSTPGVRRVTSEIQSPTQLSENETWRDTKNVAGDAAASAKSTASDIWITSATKARLVANNEIKSTDINVDTENGMVTLFGMVPSQSAKVAAETEAKKASGVRGVKNELQIVASANKEAVENKDGDIEDHVQKRLDGITHAKSVNIEVSNGVVRLTGQVPSTTERHKIVSAAKQTAGVRNVIDEMEVRAE